MTRLPILVPVLLCLSVGSAAAFEQPPITSPQDKACRDEATAKVFDAPDPNGIGLYEVGRGLYNACMQRASASAPVKTVRRVRGPV